METRSLVLGGSIALRHLPERTDIFYFPLNEPGLIPNQTFLSTMKSICVTIGCIFGLEICSAQVLVVSTLGQTGSGTNIIRAFNPSTNSWNKLFESKKYVLLEHSIDVSPNDKFVAMLGTTQKFIETKGGSYYESLRLFLINRSRRRILTQDSVCNFAWSPKGDKIAWISGIRIEGKDVPISFGIHIYDFRSKQKKQLTTSSDVDVRWASFDGNIHAQTRMGNPPFVIYDPMTGKQEISQYRGIDFSPNGEFYYLRYDGEGRMFDKLYERASNLEVKLPGDIAKRNPTFVKWMRGEPAVVIVGDYVATKHVVDVKNARVVGTFDGQFLAYDVKQREVIIRQGIKVERIRIKIK